MGQTSTVCAFCHHPFQVAAPAPPPQVYAPPPPPQWAQQPIPSIVIVPPGEFFESSVGTTAASAATFAGLRVLFALIPVLVIAGIGGATWFTAGRGMFGGSWNGSAPLVCGGNDTITASDVSVSYSSGSAINVGGNCHFKCTRCTLRAPVAVMAGGNAQVDLIDSHVEGSSEGIMAGGNAQVRMLGNSTLVGDVTKGGNADVTAPPGARTAPAPGAPAIPIVPPRSSPSPAVPNRGPFPHR
jgi:hypothetical protein